MPKVSQMLESKYLKKDDVGEDGTICTVRSFAARRNSWLPTRSTNPRHA